MNLKKITHHVAFWLVIAFVAGFGLNEVASRTNLNPLRSSAHMYGADYGGLPTDCSTFDNAAYNCGYTFSEMEEQMYGGGGYGGGYSGGGSGWDWSCWWWCGNDETPSNPDNNSQQPPANPETTPPPRTESNTSGNPAGDTCVWAHGTWICYNQ